MSRINTNVSSLIAQRVLRSNNDNLNTSLQRLSTGLKINTGADNPAGTGPQWTDVEMVLGEDQGTLSGDWYNQTDKVWEKGGIKITSTRRESDGARVYEA